MFFVNNSLMGAVFLKPYCPTRMLMAPGKNYADLQGFADASLKTAALKP